MVALLHAAHGALARILIGVAAQEVVEQAFAHRAIRHAHGLDAELLEHLGEDRDAAGERQLAIVGDRIQLQIADVLEFAELVNDAFQAIGADVDRGWDRARGCVSPMARTVPELPTASSKPRRRNAAW